MAVGERFRLVHQVLLHVRPSRQPDHERDKCAKSPAADTAPLDVVVSSHPGEPTKLLKGFATGDGG